MGGGASVAKKDDVPKYVQTIRKGQGAKLIKTLELVETLSAANENKEYLCGPSLGLVSELCDILNKDGGEARDTALKIVFNLSSLPKNTPELLDAGHGLIILLANVLSSAAGSARITAFTILLNLGSGPKCTEKVLNPLHGLTPAIIKVLKVGDKELSKYSVSLLGVLFMAPEGCASMGPGAIDLLQPLTDVLLRHTGSLQAKTVNVVKRLLETATAETRVAGSSTQLGLLNALLALANNSKGDGNHVKALQAMRAILSEEASVANVAVTGNGIIAGVARLVDIEETSSEAIDVLDAVLNTKISSCKTYLALADAGVAAAISEVLGNKNGPLDRKVWALRALRNLLSVEDSKVLLGTEKLCLIPLLVSYARSRTPELMDDVVTCLAMFATVESLIPQMMVKKYELLPTLVNIVSTDKGDGRFRALGLLHNAAGIASVRESLCSYQLGLMNLMAPILDERSPASYVALSMLYVVSMGDEDQVWFSSPDLGILPALIKIAGTSGQKSPESKKETKLAYSIIRNMSKTPINRQYMATPKIGLIPFLLEACKNGGKTKSAMCIETLSCIAEDSQLVCEPFINYDFYPSLVDIIRSTEGAPSTWAADSAESIALTLLMNVCQWPHSHPPLLRIPDTVPSLILIAAGDDVQAMKAVLTLAMLIGSSEDPKDASTVREGRICQRALNSVFVKQTRSSRNLTNIPNFPMKVTLRAVWILSISDANKDVLLSSPKLVMDLCGALNDFVKTPDAAKFNFDYEIAKRVAETIVDVLLSTTMLFPSPDTILSSDAFTDVEGLLETLSLVNSTDMKSTAKHTAAMLSWRLKNVKVHEEESFCRNFIAIIYSWPATNTSKPELIECFALSLKSMNYNVVLVENGRCNNLPELSSWDLPENEAFPAAILSRCSAVVVAVSSALNDSPSGRLMAQTAFEMRQSEDLAVEFVSLESDFSLERSDKNLGMKCCSSWLRNGIGKSKVRSLWNISNVESVSNKIGEAFDGIKALRGKAVPKKKKRALQYTKKDPHGNEKCYEIAWGILQVPKKSKNKEELAELIGSIGVYNPMDLQLCDFDDLVCISKLLKKVQMKNFNEMVLDIVSS